MSVPRPLAPQSVEAVAHKHGRFGGGAGPRLFLLFGAGLAWLIPGLWNPTYFYALAIWDGVLFVAFLIDLFHSAARREPSSHPRMAQRALHQSRIGRQHRRNERHGPRPQDRRHG